MPNLRTALPPLTALVAFEAAARRLSFTEAASELNVSQAAVSHQIAALETRLGTVLFRRLHRRIELTAAGEELGRSTSAAFGQIVQSVRAISADESGPSLVVATTTAFSHFWLMPRLSVFRAACPGISIRISAQDMAVSFDDINADAIVRYAPANAPGRRGISLFSDSIVPVASPDYLRTFGLPARIDNLAWHTLIDHDRPDPSWLDWADYLASAGSGTNLLERVSVRCSSYLDIVYAALDHQGIAMGWRSLVTPMIGRGQLVALPLPDLPTPGVYNLNVSDTPRSKRALGQFVEWISRQTTEPEPQSV